MHLIQSTRRPHIGSPTRCLGHIFLLLSIAPSVFEGGLRETSQVVAEAWLFDLISLTQPRGSPTKPYQPFSRYGTGFYQDVPQSIPGQRQWIQTGRKTIRETPNSKDLRQPLPYGRRALNAEQSVKTTLTAETRGEPMEQSTISDATPASQQNLLSQELAVCHALTGLTPQQKQICLQHSGLVWAMLEGTHLGLHECMHQFQHEQWNCSAVNILYQMRGKPTSTSSLPAISGMEGILQRGSREAAFLSSTWSAGVVQAITRACSRGQMATCDCDPQRREGQDQDAEGVFTWGGCSDPIKFGMRLTRLFLDANDRAHRQASIRRERQLHGASSASGTSVRGYMFHEGEPEALHIYQRFARSISRKTLFINASLPGIISPSNGGFAKNKTTVSRASSKRLSPQELQSETLRIIQTKARALMNLHNRRAGRRLIWKTRIRKCKCHGVSGACSMRTCWQRVNEFRHIGSILKAAYGDAVRVSYDPSRDVLKPAASQRRRIHLNNGFVSSSDRRAVDHMVTHRLDSSGKSELKQPGWHTPMGQRISTTGYPEDGDDMDRWRRQRRPRAVTDTESVSKGKLIYLEESPNYCRYDPTIGHLGIAGRLCNASNTFEANSCARLCCDKGYDTFNFESESKCECKFIWCCEVRCKICRERIIEHRCKH
ncbi:unnamed protein product [Dicrocoelium dendriticum]|nr:unnamed protein product [Dicrocoelium dendriticum]CAH8548131.1 unnamed protein product [Dicrocoelium dendriticum]